MSLSDIDSVDSAYQRLNEWVRPGVELPDYVFQEGVIPSGYVAFATVFQDENFFSDLQSLNRESGISKWWFLALDPTRSYYEEHFGFAPAYCFQNRDSFAKYRAMYDRDPGGSPADALWARGLVFCILPNTNDWLIYADRDFELSIFATKESVANTNLPKLINKYGGCGIADAQRIWDVGIEPVGAIEAAFLKNYSAPSENSIRAEVSRKSGNSGGN